MPLISLQVVFFVVFVSVCCLLDFSLCLPFCFKPTAICFRNRIFTVVVPFDYLSDCSNNLLRVKCLGSLFVFLENEMTQEKYFSSESMVPSI